MVEMNSSSAMLPPPDPAAFTGTGNQISPSIVNAYRINKVLDNLVLFVQPGNRRDPYEFYCNCLSLSRGIDYALANGETPARAHDLPRLMKQICQQKSDELLQAAIMVLMISVKIGKVYSSLGSINAGPSSCNSSILTIMERFYPKMKFGPILASIEAKPGYGASAIDFHITKSKALRDKIFLLVAQTDNIETSACLISPQQVNFLLNGKGVINRNNVQMDPGPQMPTNVNGMLKYGTNLLQAVGQFNGHYVILVAYMSVKSLPEHPVLQDYFQPAVTSIDSDIIEGPSQISLNCPISFTRIKIPVKGHSCKHFQCFDFDNFINMNSKRPSWRCPHCNQYVCYADIRLDRNMVEILKNVGENITEVFVLADGSWKAVLEKDHDADKMQNKGHNCEKEQTAQQESTCSPSTVPSVLDLTKDDDHLETMDSCEMTDRKPFRAPVLGQFVTPVSTCLGMNSATVNQNIATQVHTARGRSDTPMFGVSDGPVLLNTTAHACHQESEGHDNNTVVNSSMHNQFSAPNNLPMQLSYLNPVNEYGRSSTVPRNINRTQPAVQALPAQPQALGAQQNSITNFNNSLLPSSSSATHISLSNPAPRDSFNALLSDTERQQHFSRPPMNLPQVSGVNSPAFQHQTVTQSPFRPHGSLTDFSNPHLHQALNSRSHMAKRSSNTQRSHIQQGGSQSGMIQAPVAAAINLQNRVIPSASASRQGSSQARTAQTAGATTHNHQDRVMYPTQATRQSPSVSVQNQTTVAGTSFATCIPGLTGAQRANPAKSVCRPDEYFNLQSGQNRPPPRMRGSIDITDVNESITQRIITPTQPVQSSRPQASQQVPSSRPQGSQPMRPTSGISRLDALNANINAHNSSSR
ncbi:E4 SUMO-protein ligase PIAL2-like isoform X2 [Abrus precatorius]|uniref:E4 SUMO-protein ligase PIAL2-like isoform X2 n=1 Tax=Abrus precatorius TaxID=3816 RepID=A0A8B8LTN7_ABRPR|nr:E4 SUMO-protein ligase PIAL2-like isoform X2 [Abrus precatorius]